MIKKISLLLALLVLAGLPLISADISSSGMGGMYGMMSGGYGFGGMFFGWLFGLLVVVALILLIVWLIKQIQKSK